MKVGYRWLQDYVTIPWQAAELAHRLTSIGTAVDSLEPVFERINGVVVGRVVHSDSVPGRSDLKVLTVEDGIERRTVVSGAPNAQNGIVVAYARPGAKLPGANEPISTRTFGNIESQGVCCSERELGLSEDHEGLMLLDPEEHTVGHDLWSALGLDDTSLSFELTPNRGDCLSVFGIAREIGALVGSRIRRPEFHLTEVAEPANKFLCVRIDDPEGCPRYAGRLVLGGRVRPSPWWIKHRLKSAGLRPINNAVDISNFVMLETGQPLHAFDWSKFTSGEVLVTASQEGEDFTTLDGKARKLPEKTVMITDGGRPVAIGGIMGGQDSEVSPLTSDFLIESANFSPVRIRRSRKKLDLVTDASQRFERSADPNGVQYALDRAADLFVRLTGGRLLSGAVDNYPSPVTPVKLELDAEWVNRLLGTKLSTPTMIDVLASLEFGVMPGKSAFVTVPTFRPDVTKPVDLAEEIARVHGYEKIPVNKRSSGSLPTPRSEREVWEGKLRIIAEGLGYTQIVCNSLVDPSQALVTEQGTPVSLRNPLSSDLAIMRTDLYGTLLAVLAHNLNRRVDAIAVYELGTSYLKKNGDQPFRETRQLLLSLCGNAPAAGWDAKARPYDFFDLKGHLEALLQAVGTDWHMIPQSTPPLSAGESFLIKSGQAVLGEVGRIDPGICARVDVKVPVYAAVLALDTLRQSASHEIAKYRELPRFPAAYRDLAVVVDDVVAVGALEATIRLAGGEVLENVSLFDLYRGKPLPEGKKNVAFAMAYRRSDRTLTDEEADAAHRSIVEVLGREFGAKLRE